MIERLFIGNKAEPEQVLPGLQQGVAGHGQTLNKGRIRIVTESLGIGDGHQEKIEGRGRVTAIVDVTVTDKTVIHPAELCRHLADALRV